ncbi:MAG: protein kinase [Gemmatimonadota bacterium]
MSDERWEQTTEWFEEALRREGAERENFLASIQDPELEAELRSLLAAHESSGPVDDLLQHVTGPAGGKSDRFRSGDRLGSYEIVEEIATGGMATVYLAQDTRHGRRVAVKVLRPELAAYLGPERFLREMQTMARLQHPHILPLFDSGEAEGLLYYVMPYVDNDTLRDRLNTEKQLGVEEAVRITREIADALDYAHRHGVLHRDIKPGNILLHEGRPMLADFGIALPLGPGGPARTTEVGLSLGTPHYMSPEQATAEQELTPKSDLYSLACVLYEMLAGSPPHAGASSREVLQSIVTGQVEPVTERRRSVPSNVAAATEKALAKLPADRFGSAREFAAALADPRFSTGDFAARTRARSSRAGVSPWLLGFAAVAALAAIWGWMRSPKPAAVLPVAEFTVAPPDSTMSFRPGLALSPDGRRLMALVNTEEGSVLYQRHVDSRDWRRIPGTEGASGPVFFSPDGDEVGFHAEGLLKRVSLDGGSPVTITAAPQYWGGSWGKDGMIVYTASSRAEQIGFVGLFRVPASGGESERLTSTDRTLGEIQHYLPHHLPGGEFVLFTIVNDLIETRLAVVSLETGEIARLVPGTSAQSTADGRVVYVTPDGRVVTHTFDPEALVFVGNPRTIAEDVARMGGTAMFSMSRTGSIAYLFGPAGSDRLVLVDRAGQARTLYTVGGGSRVQVPRYSPSGDRLAFIVNDGTEWRGDVWVYSFTSGTAQRLSFEGPSSDPAWSPDGALIGYSAIAEGGDGTADLFVRAADGTGSATMILSGEDDLWQLTFTPNSTEPKKALLDTDVFHSDPALSPDGRWLAYTSMETGSGRIYVRSYPDMGPPTVVSTGGAEKSTWSGDGREIFYRAFSGAEAGRIVAAKVRVEGSRISVVDREPLFRLGPYRDHYNRNYALHPSGEQFVMVGGTGGTVVWRTGGLENEP